MWRHIWRHTWCHIKLRHVVVTLFKGTVHASNMYGHYVALHVFKKAHSGTHVAPHASENVPTFTNGTVHTADTSGDVYFSGTFAFSQSDKKLSYRRVTARCVLSVVIFPVATQQCRNYLYDKS